jgi:Trehalose utilisation
MKPLYCILLAAAFLTGSSVHAQGVVYEGKAGPGKGKHVVLIAGDEEYRSEEAMPQLGKILAVHHGFKCTILFSIDPASGTIDPNKSNIPGLEALQSADLMILDTRFRNLPDEQMKHFVDYFETGKPIVALRTATHAFNIPKGKTYSKYSYNSKEWDGGFGRQILGETWVNHHGSHGKQSTRGLIAKGMENNPVLKGIKDGDIWGPSDVYTVRLPLPEGCQALVMGQVLVGMNATDEPLKGAKNDPMMPIAWTRILKKADGKTMRSFTTTMGASQDLLSEGLRRLLVNATYWDLGMESQIVPDSSMAIVGEYSPRGFANNGFKKGVRPEDLQMK